ncbi:MAG: cation transporter [Actinomycetota bacterium]|nr:cation transporter [Actinomycetota bacterium]
MTGPRPLGPSKPSPKDVSVCADGCCAPDVPTVPDAAWIRHARTVRLLSWFSLVWMVLEGALGLVAGGAAGSVSLIGWALSSAVEGLASIIVIWRFTGSRTLSETAEGRAQKAVAISFWLLAPYVAVQSVIDLATGHRAENSLLGIVLTAASLIIMPVLGLAKHRLGARLNSGATAGEGTQNLLCAATAAAVLIGLAGNALFGAWWLDPIIGLIVAAVAVKEGREAWRGEDCC